MSFFEELMEGARQAAAIRRGEMKPSRVFRFEDADTEPAEVAPGPEQPSQQAEAHGSR
jgi:hypothetical protein